MAEETRKSLAGGKLTNPGPYLAKIISHLDPTYMGKLQVQLLREIGNDDSQEGQTHSVSFLSPFAGQTSVAYVAADPDDYNNTQKSYGMWMIPPDPGNIGMVIFIDGDPKSGYWIGSVQDQGINFSMPGYAATSFNVDGIEPRVPVAEYNKVAQPVSNDVTKIKKPASPMQTVLQKQGLLRDDIRGITTSSARREWPSAVFGVSTPGPIDKQNGAKRGPVGKAEHKIPNAFVSRLGGSSFVMDDGDDKFIRRTAPASGPPEYAAVEQNDTAGINTIPHNELIRIRTRTGHQILLHNSEDLIYIGNARGTSWIELTSDGKMDIYCEDSVSIHTKNDFNVTADRDINLTAGRNVNINSGNNFLMTAAANYEITAGADGNLMVGGQSNIKAGGNHVETAAQIHMNGPAAASAVAAAKSRRVPKHEPWSEHENLDPLSFKPDKTEAVAAPADIAPSSWKQYSTATDTFARVKG